MGVHIDIVSWIVRNMCTCVHVFDVHMLGGQYLCTICLVDNVCILIMYMRVHVISGQCFHQLQDFSTSHIISLGFAVGI